MCEVDDRRAANGCGRAFIRPGWKTAVGYADSKRLLKHPHAVGKVLGLRELVGEVRVVFDLRVEPA